uniref:Uncharacterized protein n=1 Tax=Oryza meridionalis TaxID=40149 RepID=A0A0E0CW30_9ORYZ
MEKGEDLKLTSKEKTGEGERRRRRRRRRLGCTWSSNCRRFLLSPASTAAHPPAVAAASTSAFAAAADHSERASPPCASQPHRLFSFIRTVQPLPSPPSATATVAIPPLAMEWHEALGGAGCASLSLPQRSRRSGLAGLKMARVASTASRWRASAAVVGWAPAEQGSGEDDDGGSVVPGASVLGAGEVDEHVLGGAGAALRRETSATSNDRLARQRCRISAMAVAVAASSCTTAADAAHNHVVVAIAVF